MDSHGRCQRCEARPGVIRAGSRSDRDGFVLLDNVRRDAPALADRDALVFRPRPDIATALMARSSTHRAGALSPSRLAGMVNVGRDLPAEPAGILLAEVDLVVGAAEPEPQRLIRWAAIKVVFEFDSDPLRHHGLHGYGELSAPYKINRHPVITTTLILRLPHQASCRRSAGNPQLRGLAVVGAVAAHQSRTAGGRRQAAGWGARRGASGWRYRAITSGMERLELLVEPLAATSSDWPDLHGMQNLALRVDRDPTVIQPRHPLIRQDTPSLPDIPRLPRAF